MPSFSIESARPCGKGQHSAGGSVTNLELASAIRRYKRGIASRYTALVPDELDARLPPGPYLVSPKVDYTERTEDPAQISSLLLALIRPDGTYQVIGHCGSLGSEEHRRKLGETVRPLSCNSNYSEANTKGAMFQPVRPSIVVEIRISDVQGDTSSGDAVQRMVLTYDEDAWQARRRMPGVSILHPRLVRVRDDKQAVEGDAPVRQVFERVLVREADTAAPTAELPKSEVLRREAFTKVTKGKTAVRKLLVWKTNKDAVDPLFPAYVVHFTDYSPGRKDPLKRTVRLAPDELTASALAEELLASEIKKGWKST